MSADRMAEAAAQARSLIAAIASGQVEIAEVGSHRRDIFEWRMEPADAVVWLDAAVIALATVGAP